MEFDRATGLAEGGVGTPEIPQADRLPLSVAYLSGDRQGLLVQLDGAAGLAEGGVGGPHVAQVDAFPFPLTNFAVNNQGLFVCSDRAAGLTEGGVGVSDVPRYVSSAGRSSVSLAMVSARS